MNGRALKMVAVRRATSDDLEALVQLQGNAEIRFPSDGWLPMLRSTEFFTDLAEDMQLFGFVTVGPSKLAGLAGESCGEVMGLYIKPDYRRHGMGKRLLVRGLTVLKRRGFDSARIWLSPAVSPAVKLVRTLDFKTDGTERYSNEPGRSTRFEVAYELSLTDYF